MTAAINSSLGRVIGLTGVALDLAITTVTDSGWILDILSYVVLFIHNFLIKWFIPV